MTKEIIDDFGFTLEDSVEEQAVLQIGEINIKAQMALDELYERFLPLLNNLQKSPEKSVINWPDRVEKITKFKEELAATKKRLRAKFD